MSSLRDIFREAVFNRDNHKCVVCGKPAVDAHHLMERRLWNDGGYVLDNGVSVCEQHHLDAERTIFHPWELREMAGITQVVLPEHLYPDYQYDKWGNILNSNGTRVIGELFHDESVQKVLREGNALDKFGRYIKYPRTYHIPHSPGRTKDDRGLPDYSIFEGNDVVVTEKMDGENTTVYSDGYIHARSLETEGHESRDWAKRYLRQIAHNIPSGWRVCGENLFAKHSIHYKYLRELFEVFSIWNDRNECLSWSDTMEWCQLLDLIPVPTISLGPFHGRTITSAVDYVQGRNRVAISDECEGFVIRNTHQFPYSAFRHNVGKFVRAQHVQTNQHWLRTEVTPNKTFPEAYA